MVFKASPSAFSNRELSASLLGDVDEDEKKHHVPRQRSSTPISEPSTADFSLLEDDEKTSNLRDRNISHPSSLSGWQKMYSAITNAIEPLRITSAATHCIKVLKSLSPPPFPPYPFHAIYLQACEQRALTVWAKTISEKHTHRGSLCPFSEECSSFKNTYQRDLRQIAPHSKMAQLLLESTSSLRGRISEKEEEFYNLVKLYVETAFQSYSPPSEAKPTSNKHITAIYKKLLEDAEKISHWESLTKSFLVKVANRVLEKLTSHKYASFSWGNSDVIRLLHPFIMEKLQEFALPLTRINNALPNFATMEFEKWLELTRWADDMNNEAYEEWIDLLKETKGSQEVYSSSTLVLL